MSHLPVIAASFLAGSGPAPAGETAWFSLTELERIVYAFSSLRDDENEDFDSGQSEPSAEELGEFWVGDVDGDATLGAGAFADTKSFQLSGPAVSGAFWSIGDVDLSMTATEPLLQAFTGGASRMSFLIEVAVPTRVEAFVQLIAEGSPSADTLAWARLRAGVDEDAPSIYELSTPSGELLVEEPRTLPAGQYVLEAGSRSEVFDVMGETASSASFSVSFTPAASCNASDVADPLGELDISDVLAFLDAFAQQRTDADLAWPPLVYDISDVIEFLGIWAGGCP